MDVNSWKFEGHNPSFCILRWISWDIAMHSWPGKAAGFDCVTKPREPGKVRVKSALLWNRSIIRWNHFQFSRGTHLGLDRAIEELSLQHPESSQSRPSLLDRYLLRPSHNGAWRLHLAERCRAEAGRSIAESNASGFSKIQRFFSQGSRRFKGFFSVFFSERMLEITAETLLECAISKVKASFRSGRCAWPEGRGTVQRSSSRDCLAMEGPWGPCGNGSKPFKTIFSWWRKGDSMDFDLYTYTCTKSYVICCTLHSFFDAQAVRALS